MKYIIDEDVLEKWGIPLPAFLALLLVKLDNKPRHIERLTPKYGVTATLEGFVVPKNTQDLIYKILLDAEKNIPKEDSIEPLAQQLMEIFPKGKKPGTAQYWRGNLKDNKTRLLKFFKMYGNKYSNEQIIEATKRYVDSFNGIYDYMRVLKYFIWKDAKKVNSNGEMYIEEVSDLASVLENDDTNNDPNWMQTLK